MKFTKSYIRSNSNLNNQARDWQTSQPCVAQAADYLGRCFPDTSLQVDLSDLYRASQLLLRPSPML